MSPRHFARAFAAETGVTPAKAIERLRLEAAREQVESGAEPIEGVAAYTGFGDPERMRRAFIRAFGQPPQALRRTAKIGSPKIGTVDTNGRGHESSDLAHRYRGCGSRPFGWYR
jgi:transcriptional regulator GlxA family with amidase domain